MTLHETNTYDCETKLTWEVPGLACRHYSRVTSRIGAREVKPEKF